MDDQKKKHARVEDGVYSCPRCGSELFSSKEKFDSGSGWPSFHKSLDEKRFEFRQEPETDTWVIRCSKCQTGIGHVIPDGKNNYYRVDSTALDFEQNEALELELPEGEEKDERDEEKEGPQASTQTTLLIVGGTVVGVLLGAGAGYVLCQNLCVSPLLSAVATSTPLVATSTPITETSSTPRAPAERSAVSPAVSGTSAGTPDAQSTSSTTP